MPLPVRSTLLPALAASLALALVTAAPLDAQTDSPAPAAPEAAAEPAPAAPLRIELNQLEPVEGACRILLVAENSGDTDITALTLETVLFDRDDRVVQLTLLDLQDLPAGRMRVRRFDLAGVACDGLGRLLINGRDCQPAEAGICLQEPALAARVDVDLRQ